MRDGLLGGMPGEQDYRQAGGNLGRVSMNSSPRFPGMLMSRSPNQTEASAEIRGDGPIGRDFAFVTVLAQIRARGHSKRRVIVGDQNQSFVAWRGVHRVTR
jgi:hypothetical protein